MAFLDFYLFFYDCFWFGEIILKTNPASADWAEAQPSGPAHPAAVSLLETVPPPESGSRPTPAALPLPHGSTPPPISSPPRRHLPRPEAAGAARTLLPSSEPAGAPSRPAGVTSPEVTEPPPPSLFFFKLFRFIFFRNPRFIFLRSVYFFLWFS